jgi:hypothetical protein
MPFGQALSDEITWTVDAPTATGTTTIDSTAIDMADYTGVLFIVRLGSPAANNDIRVQQDTVVGMGTAADLAGSKDISTANNVCVIEYIPAGTAAEQFVRCRVTRGTTTTIDTMIAIRFGKRVKPAAVPSGTTFKAITGVIEGTA